MNDVILHHYPQSPVSEKVRVVLGIKDLAWQSVNIPRFPPKPDLTPLTGGYRRTPVMQIGANAYCDSQCIVRELERRFPEPSLFPAASSGLTWGMSRWTDGPFFNAVIAAIFGEQGRDLPHEFIEDRGRLYFGPGFDLEALAQQLPVCLGQIRAQLRWIEQCMHDDRAFVLGDAPGLLDALFYYLVWFFRGRVQAAAAMLRQFPKLEAWELRVRAVGHGKPTELPAAAALDIARECNPDLENVIDDADPCGYALGDVVGVVPEGNGGDPVVAGALAQLTADTVALRRRDARIGEHAVFFPRVGYRIERTSS